MRRLILVPLYAAIMSGCVSAPPRYVDVLPSQETALSGFECPDGSIAESPEICSDPLNVPLSKPTPTRKERPRQVIPAVVNIAPAPSTVTKQKFIASSAPAPSPPSPKIELPEGKKPDAKAAITTAALIALIIQESRQAYYSTGHPCACPDDRMRNGRSCGSRSANSRPGGAHPICYPREVTPGMIADRKQRVAER